MDISHQKSLTFSCADIRERGGLVSQVKPDTCEDAGLFAGLLDAQSAIPGIIRKPQSVPHPQIYQERAVPGRNGAFTEGGGQSAIPGIIRKPQSFTEGGGPIRLLGIQVRIKFSVGSSAILAEGEIDGKWELECSRCLDNFRSTFAGSFDETYPETVESIDLTDAVRQTVLLSVPVKPLCSADCKGLCQKCAMNLNRGSCNCPPPSAKDCPFLMNLRMRDCDVSGAEVKPFAALKNLKNIKTESPRKKGDLGSQPAKG